MSKDRYSLGGDRILEKTINSLEERREAPLFVFLLLFLLYLASAFIVSSVTGSNQTLLSNEDKLSEIGRAHV